MNGAPSPFSDLPNLPNASETGPGKAESPRSWASDWASRAGSGEIPCPHTCPLDPASGPTIGSLEPGGQVGQVEETRASSLGAAVAGMHVRIVAGSVTPESAACWSSRADRLAAWLLEQWERERAGRPHPEPAATVVDSTGHRATPVTRGGSEFAAA